jgi:hypothetical protein
MMNNILQRRDKAYIMIIVLFITFLSFMLVQSVSAAQHYFTYGGDVTLRSVASGNSVQYQGSFHGDDANDDVVLRAVNYWMHDGKDDWRTSISNLYNIYYTVQYHADVTNKSTHVSIPDGGQVNQGSDVVLRCGDYNTHDIVWHGSGTQWDTPYGHWQQNAKPSQGFNDAGNIPSPFFLVNPPNARIDIQNSDLLECTTLSDGCSQQCKAKNPGTVNVDFVFPQTSAKFYRGVIKGVFQVYRNIRRSKSCSKDDGDEDRPSSYRVNKYCTQYVRQTVDPNTGCGSHGVEIMEGAGDDDCVTTTEGVLPVGEEHIVRSFVIKEVDGKPPHIQDLNLIGVCNENLEAVIHMKATDPDASTNPDVVGSKIRYLIDWHGGDDVDMAMEVIPDSGYLPSGTARDVTKSFASAGDKIIKVAAQDGDGLMSDWKSLSIHCDEPVTEDLRPLINIAGQCVIGQQYNIAISAFHPQGKNVYYEIDTDNKGTFANRIPGTNYISATSTHVVAYNADRQTENDTFTGSITVRVIDVDGLRAEASKSFVCRRQQGYCGDGIMQDGEECDDGLSGSDTCDSTCRTVGGSGTVCGNGIIEGSEECDGGSNCTATCHRSGNGGGGGTAMYEIEAHPRLVRKNGHATINWNIENVSACKVTEDNPTFDDTWADLHTNGSHETGVINQTTRYTLTCDNLPSKSVTIHIIPDWNEQ